jgi:hypothetical protein
MEHNGIEHFIHAQGVKPKVAFGKDNEPLRDVLIRFEAISETPDDVFVFVGECEEALREPVETDNGADEHAPVEISLTLAVLDIRRHRHVHVHRCRHVAVEVNFAGDSKKRRFSPATRIAVVTQWARRKFPNLDAAAAAELVLEICGTKTVPLEHQHLGELVQAPHCSICFDLIKEINPQG